ncbi:MAG: MFS transporter [Candidatus Zixiibacteriota bacterium]
MKLPWKIWAWASYDFANTIFSMNVVSLYFAQWVIFDLGQSELSYSLSYSLSMLAVALTLPVLGSLADKHLYHHRFLVIFTLICIAATTGLGLLGNSALPVATMAVFALVLFGVANYFFEGGIVFYNSLLPEVSKEMGMGKTSGIGVGLGYFGTIAGLYLVRPFVADGTRADAFIPTAVLFLIFSFPIFYLAWHTRHAKGSLVAPTYSFNLWKILKETRQHPGLTRFLIADFLLEDAVVTIIIYMAVYMQKVYAIPDSVKTNYLALATTAAIAGAFLAGWVTDKIGPRRTLKFVFMGWLLALAAIAFAPSVWVFYVLGGFVGMFLGATWTSSRPLLAQLVPKEKLGQFFGLYSLSGRAAAIVGPIVWGLVVKLPLVGSGSYRAAVLALDLMVLFGFLIYLKMPKESKA